MNSFYANDKFLQRMPVLENLTVRQRLAIYKRKKRAEAGTESARHADESAADAQQREQPISTVSTRTEFFGMHTCFGA
jgi:hypothetical protein